MSEYISPVTLHLATLDGIAAGLAQLGAQWDPRPFALDNLPTTNGLYAWATDDGALIYIGIGEGQGGNGLATRISYEDGAATADYIHGHSLAITRLTSRGIRVRPYAGDVVIDESFNATWIRDEEWTEDRVASIRMVIDDLKANPYKQAEKFAVRLSVHLGDIGVPVNSAFKGAWNFRKDSPVGRSDDAAYMVANRLARLARDCSENA